MKELFSATQKSLETEQNLREQVTTHSKLYTSTTSVASDVMALFCCPANELNRYTYLLQVEKELAAQRSMRVEKEVLFDTTV